MSYEEDPKEMMLKFRWVNDGAIKVLNKEGVELMIDVANSEFTQLAYNKLCNYNHEKMKETNYYFDEQGPKPPQVSDRLMRRCEMYKSALLMMGKDEFLKN